MSPLADRSAAPRTAHPVGHFARLATHVVDTRDAAPDLFTDVSATDWTRLRWADVKRPYRVEKWAEDKRAWERANGQPLPATLWTQDDGASATLVGESLVFGAGDRLERQRVIRQRSAQGETTTEASTIPLAYRRAGPSIEIGWFEPCPPNALCIANDRGTLTTSEVRLTSHMYHVGDRPAELRYEALRLER